VKRLYRSRKDRKLAGVCGGLGAYCGWDPVIFRIVRVLLALGYGVGVVAYLVCWFVVPEEPPADPPL
jgi:phage shock protein PspC (stress-responsive transcriptional regulator)